MNSVTGLRFALLLTVWATTWPTAAAAQTTPVLASQGILLPPAFAAVLMSASTVIVAINAQLLRRAKV